MIAVAGNCIIWQMKPGKAFVHVSGLLSAAFSDLNGHAPRSPLMLNSLQRTFTASAEMMIALDSMIKQGENLLSDLKMDFSTYEQKIRNKVYLYKPLRSKYLTEMEKAFQRINEEWNLMVSCKDKLLSDGKHVRTLFVIRES